MAHQLDQQQLTNDTNQEWGNNTVQKIAQSFKPSIQASLSKIVSTVVANGSPGGGINCDIYSNNNGVPGNLLVSADSVLGAANVGGNVVWTFGTIFLLAPNNNYWIVFSRNVALDDSNDFLHASQDGSVSKYGRGKALGFNGTNWVILDSTVSNYVNLYFQEFYNDSTVIKQAATHYSSLQSKTHVKQDQTFPSNPIVGDYFWDSFNNRMCIYNGTQWVFRQFTTTTSTSTSTTTTSTSTTTTSTSSSTSITTSTSTSTSTTTTL